MQFPAYSKLCNKCLVNRKGVPVIVIIDVKINKKKMLFVLINLIRPLVIVYVKLNLIVVVKTINI